MSAGWVVVEADQADEYLAQAWKLADAWRSVWTADPAAALVFESLLSARKIARACGGLVRVARNAPTPGQDGREGTETNEGSGEGVEALQGRPGAGNGHLRKGG